MSGPFGISGAGFLAKPATQSKLDFDAAFKAIYGASIGSNPDGSIPASTSIGQEIVILVDSESAAWLMQQAIYAGFDPDEAVSPQLQILCALTGTRQKLATFSTVVETCFGVAGTQLPPGRVVAIPVTGTRFDSQPNPDDANAPNSTLTAISAAWATSTAYALSDIRNASDGIWQCIVPGTSRNSGIGPTVAGSVSGVFTESTGVEWRYVCALALGVALVPFQAEESGPLAATAPTLSSIATPVAGWQGALNALDASLGTSLETDAQLRVRRQEELQSAGGGPADAVRAAILQITTVEACIVFVNSTDAVVDGVPAHGVEVLILDSRAVTSDTNQDLANHVWAAVGAGTATGGGITKTVIDASGNPQTVSFSRPTAVPIYIVEKVYYDATIWTSHTAVEQAVTAAILNAGALYTIGEQVRASPISAASESGAYAVDGTGTAIVPAPAGSPIVPGILEVRNGAGTDGTLPYIGTATSPVTSTTVAITKRQIATFSAAHISVVASSESP
jgi:uncharacterized phage protein gp47/JayE